MLDSSTLASLLSSDSNGVIAARKRSVARRFSIKSSRSLSDLAEVQVFLVAVDRCCEAADIAEAVGTSKVAAKDVFLSTAINEVTSVGAFAARQSDPERSDRIFEYGRTKMYLENLPAFRSLERLRRDLPSRTIRDQQRILATDLIRKMQTYEAGMRGLTIERITLDEAAIELREVLSLMRELLVGKPRSLKAKGLPGETR